MDDMDLPHCLDTVLEIVTSAGKNVLEGFEKPKDIKTKTASWDLVTEYDRNTEIYIINRLKEAYPDHKFIAEETAAAEKLTDAPTWIIDPIDGTTNFVHGFPYCGISVGLAVQKEVVLGIVCCPPLHQTFSAIKGNGAFLNGKQIHTSKIEDVKDAVLIQEGSLAVKADLRDIYIKRFRLIAESQIQGLRNIGCAQMSLCLVAMGAMDAYEVEFLSPWDLAAGSVILTEAGGTVLDRNGEKFDCEKGRIIAASTEKLAHNLIKIFNDY